MLYSPTRELELQERDEILAQMEECLQRYAITGNKTWITQAKSFGILSERLKKRISSHDYSILDKLHSCLS